jgi:DNA (cytosine-5)-methyltransferase 1
MREPYRVLSLFAGIGGFDLGLERTGGFKTVAFCEINPFARRVLAKNWPEVPCFDDVRTLTRDALAERGIAVDVICGGFPCQDISLAGEGAGIEGARSGLWGEIARLVRELRPRILLVENVAALLSRGMDKVLGDLAACGYDAEWDCIPASAVGAPHRRDRVWLIAYPGGEQHQGQGDAFRRALAAGLPQAATADQRRAVDDALCGRHGPPEGQVRAGRDGLERASWWATEPAVGRVADGVPYRVDRLRALGNAVVPQIPELIGRAILAAEAERLAA